eukprot:767529-Hanusia_phi.AAC.1
MLLRPRLAARLQPAAAAHHMMRLYKAGQRKSLSLPQAELVREAQEKFPHGEPPVFSQTSAVNLTNATLAEHEWTWPDMYKLVHSATVQHPCTTGPARRPHGTPPTREMGL